MANKNKKIPKVLAWAIIIGFNIMAAILVSFFAYIFLFQDDSIDENVSFSINEAESFEEPYDYEENKAVEQEIVKEDKVDDIYSAIKEGLLNGEDTIDVSKYKESKNSKEVFEIINKVVNENPYIMYYKGGRFWSNGILKPEYFREKTVMLSHREIVKNRIREVINSIIKPEMTDFEKERVVHDYIINNSSYDSFNFERNTIPPESYNSYGILIKGVGVCEGYAKTMKLFMDELGIEAIIVSGTGKGQSHAWNLVKIEDEYYHVDLTWNDPVMDDNSKVLRYDYFNLTDLEMKREHNWDQNDYPRAISTKYNYHYYNNLTASSYEEFYNNIKNTLLNDERELEMKILPYYDKNIYDVYKTTEDIIMNNHTVRINSVNHSINDKIGVVNIEFH